MANTEITREMRANLLRAKDQEEVRALLGPEAAEEKVERVWQEIQRHRPAEGLEDVDDDELEAVSGGVERDWAKEGCADTAGNWDFCWSIDSCVKWSIDYINYDPCPNGGAHDWLQVLVTYDTAYSPKRKYRVCECRKCKKREKRYDDAASNFNPGELQ